MSVTVAVAASCLAKSSFLNSESKYVFSPPELSGILDEFPSQAFSVMLISAVLSFVLILLTVKPTEQYEIKGDEC